MQIITQNLAEMLTPRHCHVRHVQYQLLSGYPVKAFSRASLIQLPFYQPSPHDRINVVQAQGAVTGTRYEVKKCIRM